MNNATKRALPEKYRLARNIRKGYEVRVDCDTHKGGHWLQITSVLQIFAPLQVCSFTTAAPDCVNHLARFGVYSTDELYSRRPAGAS